MRSRANADALVKVVERMSTYPQLAFPLMPQKLVAAQIGGGEDPMEQRLAGWRRQAQYLSTVNLSSIDNWNYSFKTHPRPRGRATQGHLHRMRSARADPAAARRDRGFGGHGLVCKFRRADSR